ncbi:MAG: hypothetical protein WC244_03675 [Patescibacteria group bacterium]|jgi:thiol-disulfide isomerase/thioredoxin
MEGEIKKSILKIFKDRQFLLGILGGIIIVAIIGIIIFAVAFLIKGKTNDTTDNSQQLTVQEPTTAKVTASGISTFSMKKDAKICQEDGKPIIYLFSTTWCAHCNWIKATFDQAMAKYVKDGKIVAYHWETDEDDNTDNTLTSSVEKQMPASAQAVYQEFDPKGLIPAFVFGCKYFRIGNGYEAKNDLASEVKEFDAIIKDLIK